MASLPPIWILKTKVSYAYQQHSKEKLQITVTTHIKKNYSYGGIIR